MADLESQFEKYSAKLDRDVEDLGVSPVFEDAAGGLHRDVNTLILLAMAIGQSEEEGQFKSAAPRIVEVGREIIAADNPADAAAGVETLKKIIAAPDSETGGEIKWEKAAHLPPLMKKALPSLTTEIKRLGRNEKTFKRGENSAKVAGNAATLAVIAVGCRPNVDETTAPDEEELWKEYCDVLYASAMKLNETAGAVRDGNGTFADFSAALKEVEATCSATCHEKFGGSHIAAAAENN